MKIKYLMMAVLSISIPMFCHAQQQNYPFRNPDLPIDQRINDLLERMTPEEKVGQMMNATKAIDRLGIPAYDWWNEALHGVARAGRATVFPQAIAMSASFDDKQLFNTFTMVSDEARAKYHQSLKDNTYKQYYGLTFWTPNINIVRDPRWGRGMETYGEDPYLTSRMGVAVVKGLQGNDPKYLKTHACAKHYAVHSGPESTRHSFDAFVSPRDLWTTYLPAFETLVKEGNVQEVMCAYNRFDGKPCCTSDKLLIDILRNTWSYKNIILSDCGAIADFWQKDENTPRHETHPDAESASSAAVLSGTDLECGGSYHALINAMKEGKIKETDLDVSLRRLLKGRFELGMFDPDDRVPYAKIPYSVVESPEHVAQAKLMACESMVLLKNQNHILPLSKQIKTIAIVGPNAADSTMLWANYNGFPTHTVTILEGIQNKIGSAKVIYEQGCEHVGDTITIDGQRVAVNFASTVDKVKNADVILFVGGISPRLEGEEMPVKVKGFSKGDRTDLEIPEIQQELVKALKTTGKPIVYIVCTGSALSLNWEAENADAILNAWYGGQEAGAAVADILFGDYNPAGRLPVTFYKSVSQLPDFMDYNMKGRTYRYMTETPLYPFGFGLSYTTFDYRNAKLSANTIGKDQNVTLTLDITNTGKRSGDEVAQIYVKNPNDPSGPIKALKAFSRVNIKAGKTQKVSFQLEPKAFWSFNDNTQTFEVRPGKYQILYGGSSDDTALKNIELTIQ